MSSAEAQFLAPDILGDELEEWMLDSRMLNGVLMPVHIQWRVIVLR